MHLSNRIQKSPVFLLRLLLIVWSLVSISAATDPPRSVNLAWNANPEADIAGYRVHYGTASGDLTSSLTVDTSPAATLAGLEPGTRYYCAVRAFNTSALEGSLSSEISFVIPAAIAPEITVAHDSGDDLADGRSEISLGEVDLGSTGTARTFVISNLGTADLTNLAITAAGAEFAITPLGTTTLAPGETTRFDVTFSPLASGIRSAFLRITSNDPDTGSFDIALSGTGLTAPEIEVYKDNGTSLTSGGTSVDFGNCTLGATSPRTFTIQNTGSATLTGLSVASDGPDFILGKLGSTSLPPGARTTFGISFRPGTAGTRAGRLVIASNDSDERLFLITLTGQGVKAPEIVVEVSSGRSLTDDDAFINFGTVAVRSTANSKTFTIRNTGTANLDGLGIIKNGSNSAEFRVSALRTRSLAPGASTSFKVQFSPARTGIRWAAIHITSNDADESSFDIVLTGTGSKSSTSAAAAPSLTGSHSIPTSSPVRRIELIDGRKYLTLTIARRPGTSVLPRDVEVSSNLVDWSSGKRHTTVLIDTATTLKVRDNTPVSQNARRYIRRKR